MTSNEGARQLFVIDPISRLRPAKDSSVALMQAAQRAGQTIWICTPADLWAEALPPATGGLHGHGAWARARAIRLGDIHPTPEGWHVEDPWYQLGEEELLPLDQFQGVWTVSYTHLRAHGDATLSRMPSSA